MSYKKLTLVLLFIMFVFSCQKSEIQTDPNENTTEEPADPQDIIISKDYLPLTEHNSTCTSYDLSTGVAEFHINDKNLVPQTGNVIVVHRDTIGVIRRIKSVDSLKAGNFRFVTEQASMSDIFEKANFILSTSENPSTRAGVPVFKPVKIYYLGNDSITTKGEITQRLISSEINLSSSETLSYSEIFDNDNYTISLNPGSRFATNLDLTMEFNFDNSNDMISKISNNLLNLKTYLEGDVNFDIDLSFSASKSFDIKEFEQKIKPNILKPRLIKFLVNGVPVFITCSTDLFGECTVGAEGKSEVNIGAKCNLHGVSGLSYDQASNSISNFKNWNFTAEPILPSLSVEASSQLGLSIFPRCKVYLYSLIGPVIDLKPFFSSTLSVNQEVKLKDKNNKFAPVISLVGELGIELGSSLHLKPFDLSNDNDLKCFALSYTNEIYRSPHKIDKKEVKTDDGEKKVIFSIYDTLPSKNEVVPTPLPIPVVVSKSNSDTTKTGNDTSPALKSFKVDRAKNGLIEVSVDKNTSVTEEIKQTISVDIYSESGEVISNATHDEIIKSTLRDYLIEFYNSTNGKNWKTNYLWCSDFPIKSWYGISVKDDSLFIDLPNNNLSGNGTLKGCTSLAKLNCSNNPLTSLDLSDCSSLTSLNLYMSENLKRLNLNGCSSINLNLFNSNLTGLEINGRSAVKELNISECYGSSFDLSNFTSLTKLESTFMGISALNINNCTSLSSLDFQFSQLNRLSVSNCPSLNSINCAFNNLYSLILHQCPSLTYLDCSYNSSFQKLDLSSCISLIYLNVFGTITTGVIPSNLDHVFVKGHYHPRFSYSLDGAYSDLGYGWWYPGEPDKGYHGR